MDQEDENAKVVEDISGFDVGGSCEKPRLMNYLNQDETKLKSIQQQIEEMIPEVNKLLQQRSTGNEFLLCYERYLRLTVAMTISLIFVNLYRLFQLQETLDEMEKTTELESLRRACNKEVDRLLCQLEPKPKEVKKSHFFICTTSFSCRQLAKYEGKHYNFI